MSTQSNRSKRAQALIDVLRDRPIAYHPALVKPLGGINETVFVCQLLYWDGKGSTPGGWIYKTLVEWEEETGLTRHNLDTVRRHLRDLAVLEEDLRGVPARLYYRLDFDRLGELLLLAYPPAEDTEQPPQFAATRQSSLLQPGKLDCQDPADLVCRNPANKGATSRQTISESSPENTIDGGAENVDHDLAKTWQHCLTELQMQLTANAFAEWLANTRLLAIDLETCTAILAVHSEYAADWIEHRLARRVLDVLGPMTGLDPGALTLHCTVADPPARSPPPRPPPAERVPAAPLEVRL